MQIELPQIRITGRETKENDGRFASCAWRRFSEIRFVGWKVGVCRRCPVCASKLEAGHDETEWMKYLISPANFTPSMVYEGCRANHPSLRMFSLFLPIFFESIHFGFRRREGLRQRLICGKGVPDLMVWSMHLYLALFTFAPIARIYSGSVDFAAIFHPQNGANVHLMGGDGPTFWHNRYNCYIPRFCYTWCQNPDIYSNHRAYRLK